MLAQEVEAASVAASTTTLLRHALDGIALKIRSATLLSLERLALLLPGKEAVDRLLAARREDLALVDRAQDAHARQVLGHLMQRSTSSQLTRALGGSAGHSADGGVTRAGPSCRSRTPSSTKSSALKWAACSGSGGPGMSSAHRVGSASHCSSPAQSTRSLDSCAPLSMGGCRISGCSREPSTRVMMVL